MAGSLLTFEVSCSCGASRGISYRYVIRAPVLLYPLPVPLEEALASSMAPVGRWTVVGM